MPQRSVGLGITNLDSFAHSSNQWRWKLQEPQLRRLFPDGWIIAIRCSTICQTLYCASFSLCRMPLHDWSLAHNAAIISRWYYANSIGYSSESASSSKWHVWYASCCLGRCLYLWPTITVLCSAALCSLCGQLTFLLAWCRKHSAVMATELLQPRDLACGTLFQFSCEILTSPTDCSEDSWKDTFFGKHEYGALWLCGTV